MCCSNMEATKRSSSVIEATSGPLAIRDTLVSLTAHAMGAALQRRVGFQRHCLETEVISLTDGSASSREQDGYQTNDSRIDVSSVSREKGHG